MVKNIKKFFCFIRYRKLIILLIFILGFIGLFPNMRQTTYAEIQDINISQVYVNLPDVTAYFDNNISDYYEELEAYLGSEKLEKQSINLFSDTEEAIYYYVLFDVSGSIPDNYFNNIKQGIINIQQSLRVQDKLILVSFGETVQITLDGSQTLEQAEATINALQNLDQKTLLFEALNTAADLADGVPATDCKRRVAIVISDGEDISIGKATANEACNNLNKKGIPVYALCISDTATENINNFGEFARNTGGNLYIFTADEASGVLTNVQSNLLNSSVMNLKYSTNIASNQTENFVLQIPSQNLTLSKEVLVSRWIKDSTPPEITSIEKISDTQLKVTFSESVIGADKASAYDIKVNDSPLAVIGVVYGEDGGNTSVLTFANTLYAGDYTLECVGVTDNSMEKNELTNVGENYIDGELEPEVKKSNPVVDFIFKWIGVFAIALFVILIIVIFFIYKKIKKNRGVIYVQGKPVMASRIEEHQKVVIEENHVDKLEIIVNIDGKYPQKINGIIDKSAIFGRSSICNYYFNDNSLSRQHFALDYDGKIMCIVDLNSRNGTKVNGVMINEKRQLHRGDVVTAGKINFSFIW